MQNLRKLLLPFSLLYGAIVWLRNKFFDWNWISHKSYDFPIICVGNLSVGGTGKSPMIEYLIRLLKDDFKVATLSRGYKRKTSGFYLVNGNEDAVATGDEPLQFKTKFPEITVAVDENRQRGIGELQKLKTSPEVILLDDAFQHRKVRPGFSILLTAYDSLYINDWILPAGNLREPRSGAKRADIIVVTKTPKDLSSKEMLQIKNKLSLKSHQTVYFSFIAYADYLSSGQKQIVLNSLPDDFVLVTGIANPKPLVQFLKERSLKFDHLRFPDHHNFTSNELAEIDNHDFILTTEKDFMRLKTFIATEKLFYLPIQPDFVKEKGTFDKEILDWVENKH